MIKEPNNLLIISSWKDLQTSENEYIPQWVKDSLAVAPIVVVRRAKTFKENIPVGVRGFYRSQRFAAYISPNSVKACYQPNDVLEFGSKSLHLPQAKKILRELGLLFNDDMEWGPAGSAGYEMVSGEEVMTRRSDFDIVITPHKTLGVNEARILVQQLDSFPMYVDAQVMISQGAFSLREWARGEGVLLKTADGPRLVEDPWNE
ncbi:phosphoribosyl-dephospho-CoA transferase [Geomicrobium halophilum]|uniref:Phosphoribosyl-dephospho-CoA transferase n=1 Tax=Geomicrobium halophilum TaxID=549000 RepID=A0A841Q009_9BACL|nr:malonate decarboxylase holo-ACP synthase [Geomicrobium halophilum]MBB6450783.1 phosphoribosyl-dephospho-CoA transferase [Geomicrobium halophilum]